MGGCRCSFRNCTVATAGYPNMHFFHFPWRDKERAEKWIKMADAEAELKDKPNSYKQNRVICARHFRDESVMNYKTTRLTQIAVPTLMRFDKYTAMDYDCDPPRVVRLQKPTMQHLIPPDDFKDPLEFDESDDFAEVDIEVLNVEDKDEVDEVEETLREITTGVIAKKKSTKRKILNQDIGAKTMNKKLKIISQEIICTGKKTRSNDVNESILPDNTGMEPDPDIIVIKAQDIYEERSTQTELTSEQLQRQQLALRNAEHERQSVKVNIEESKNFISNLQQKLEVATNVKKLFIKKIKKMKIEQSELKKTIDSLTAELKKAQEHKDVAPKSQTELVSTSEDISKKAVAPTKAQLFNGIKKYLSSSMVALVRMEMFGNAERDWKPDEQRTAVDLLKLGENIYKYFTDEWRFRLPAINVVSEWLNSRSELDDDEEEL